MVYISSRTTKERTPIRAKAKTNETHPLQIFLGGMQANMTFHGRVKK